jgi:hypothetical protein
MNRYLATFNEDVKVLSTEQAVIPANTAMAAYTQKLLLMTIFY